MPETPPRPEPSDLVKASRLLSELWADGHLPLQEIERRAIRAQRLAEVTGAIPFHAQRAAKDPDYWNDLYGSSANW